jgi:hypothetical protein
MGSRTTDRIDRVSQASGRMPVGRYFARSMVRPILAEVVRDCSCGRYFGGALCTPSRASIRQQPLTTTR